MKKVIIYGALLFSVTSARSQVEVTAKSFDLDSIKLHKGWRFFPGESTSNGELIVKLGKTTRCDVDKNFFGDRTFKGVGWSFLELKFDKDLNFQTKNEKAFENTMRALDYAPVFGEKFVPGGGGFVITKDYLNTTTVSPTISITNFTVSSFSFFGKVNTDLDGKYCWETIEAKKENSVIAKEEKGQKWIAQSSFNFPGGGDVLFATDGVYPEKELIHYVFKRYGSNLDVEKKIYIPFKTNISLKVLPIEVGNGKKDYMIVAQAAKKYAKAVPLSNPDFLELIYIDGENFEIKYRTISNLKYSFWNANQIIKKDDGFFIVGAAGEDAKSIIEMPGYTNFSDIKIGKLMLNIPTELPNFQIVSVNKSGNIDWVKGLSVEEAQPLVTILSGIDLKTKPVPVFTCPSSTIGAWGGGEARAVFKNNRLIISFQQILKPGSYSKPTEDRGNLVTMIFDDKGSLQRYFIKPEQTYTNHETFFSKDFKTMYWATYEYDALNDLPFENGTSATSKKVKGLFAANLHFVKFDLDKCSSEGIQHLGKGEWVIDGNNPVLLDSDDAIVFLGRTLSKKAKDTELILAKVKK
jgi:hypothetical protein